MKWIWKNRKMYDLWVACIFCWRKLKRCKFKNMGFDLNSYRLLSLSEKERRYAVYLFDIL